MKIRKAVGSGESKIGLEMTPMIDVVFQLLIFFMFSFKIVTVEGEFAITMPKLEGAQAAPSEPTSKLPDIQVQLVASGEGDLQGITVGENTPESVAALTETLKILTGNDAELAADAEIQLTAPENLKYSHVIEVINAAANANIRKMKFNPPNK